MFADTVSALATWYIEWVYGLSQQNLQYSTWNYYLTLSVSGIFCSENETTPLLLYFITMGSVQFISVQSHVSVYGGHQWELFLFEKRADNSKFNQQWNFLRDAESKSIVNFDLTPLIQGDLPLFCHNDRSGVLKVCKNDKIFLYFNWAVRFLCFSCFMFMQYMGNSVGETNLHSMQMRE